jgi:autotransporter-associated beta strand protein
LTVTVNGNGTLDLNGQTETLGNLVMVDGVGGDSALATTGAAGSGQLTLDHLNMTGGLIDIHTGTSQVTLAGDVTAISDAVDAAFINGAGQLSLGGSSRTFTVNHGAQVSDLVVNTVLSGTGSEGLIKQGAGRLQLDAVNAYTGPTTINAGDVQVDGTIGNVALQGGSISGTGNVGTIDNGTGSAAVAGTIDPGDNGTGNSAGILHSGNTNLAAGSTLFVDLTKGENIGGVAGTDNDQLVVTGNASFAGGTLTGLVGPNVILGDRFTIVTVTGGTGNWTPTANHFAEPFGADLAFIGGNKFVVDYSDPTRIVLTRVPNTIVSFTLASSNNPTVFGQDVKFTATLTPEPGVTVDPVNDLVTFTLDAASGSPVFFSTHPSASGQASFNPFTDAGLVLSVGTHTVDALFTGPGFSNANTSLSPAQQVTKANTTLNLSSTPTSPFAGQSVTVSAAVMPAAPSTEGPLPGAPGTVTFTVDGVVESPVGVVAGQALLIFSSSSPLGVLSVGTHHIKATYSGDSNYNGISTVNDFLLNVQKRLSGTTLVTSQNPAGVGQTVTFTATVVETTPGGLGTPQGVVSFFVDGSNHGNVSLNASGVAVFSINTLTQGFHNVFAQYQGNTLYTGSASNVISEQILKATTTTLTSSKNPSNPGDSVTFTATVKPATTGTPAGTVTFFVDGNLQSTVTLTVSGVVTFTTSTLPAGGHVVLAQYNGDLANFAPSNANLTQIVTSPTATALSPASATAVYSQPVAFTATVTATLPSAGPPTGAVTFKVTNAVTNVVEAQQTVALTGGQATFKTPTNLPLGSHNITAIFNGSPGFTTSTSSTSTLTVSQDTSNTALVSSLTPSGLNQSVTFTATVTAGQPPTGLPATGTPTGTVSFFVDGSATPAATVTLNGSGVATFSTSTLSFGSHSIVAKYNGSTNFAGSTSSTLTQQVLPGTTTALTSSVNPSTPGQSVTFTATVAPAPGPGTPTGTVTFFVDGVQQGAPVGLNGSEQASFTTSTLSAGSHTITARYNPDANANFSGSANTLNQTVLFNTTTTLTSSANPSTAGQSVAFTATVQSPSGGGTPTGTVTFSVDGVPQTTLTLNGSGQAFWVTSGLGVGNHTVTATYNGSSTMNGSSDSLSQTVQAGAASLSAAISGQGTTPNSVQAGVPFTITVTALDGSGGTATGFSGFIVTLQELSGPAGSSVSGQTSAAFSNGVAVLNGVIVNTPGLYHLRIFANDPSGLFVDLTFTASGGQP